MFRVSFTALVTRQERWSVDARAFRERWTGRSPRYDGLVPVGTPARARRFA